MKRYIHLNTQDIFEFLSKNNYLHKNIHFRCILPHGIKYIFCKQNLDSEKYTECIVLEGYNCEVSNLLTRPACMSEEDYTLIPDSYKGYNYNIYYIPEASKVKIRYEEQNSEFITWIDSNRILDIYTEIFNVDQFNDMAFTRFTDIFIEV